MKYKYHFHHNIIYLAQLYIMVLVLLEDIVAKCRGRNRDGLANS